MTNLIINMDLDNGVHEIRIPGCLRVAFNGWKLVTVDDGDGYIVLYRNDQRVATLDPECNDQFLRRFGHS